MDALLGALVLSAVSCSPTAPGTCGDPLGRGSSAPDQRKITCVPAGSDVRCTAIATNENDLYKCPLVNIPVTASTAWTSSDLSVGVFDPADMGLLRAVGSGRLQIDATYNLFAGLPEAFALSVGGAAEELVGFTIGITDAQTREGLPGVDVDIRQAPDATQHCTTGTLGTCPSDSRIWLSFDRSVILHVTKPGYQPQELAPSFSRNDIPWHVNVKMQREGS